MLQRIQSVYLFIAMILVLLMLYIPYCSIYSEQSTSNTQTSSYLLQSKGIYRLQDTQKELITPTPFFKINILLFWGLCGFCIFLYNNRKLQIQIAKLGILAMVILFAAINFQLFKMTDLNSSSGHILFLFGWYMPFAVILLLVLSIRAIKKDEDLVRSADRLR